MSSTGRLQADPLFQGLARPTMIAGVSFMYFVINAMVTMVTYINTSNFVILLIVGPFIHAIGYVLCMKEPRAVELLIMRCSNGFQSWNRVYHHNTNSYDVF